MQSQVITIAPESVAVPPSLLQKMVNHAERTAPNECCGVLGGKGCVITAVYPVENETNAPDRFFGRPQDLFEATRKIRSNNEQMVGIYHSHPSSPPVPSDRDREENQYPGLFYFIISLEGDEPEARCYVMNEEGEFERVSIV